MLATDENALVCDFAETYHIFDIRSLPPILAATLAVGLGDGSRIKMKLSGAKAAPETLMMAAIVDKLNLLLWSRTKDAEKGRNRPRSILDGLFERVKNVDTFDSGEDFEKEREKIMRGTHGN